MSMCLGRIMNNKHVYSLGQDTTCVGKKGAQSEPKNIWAKRRRLKNLTTHCHSYPESIPLSTLFECVSGQIKKIEHQVEFGHAWLHMRRESNVSIAS